MELIENQYQKYLHHLKQLIQGQRVSKSFKNSYGGSIWLASVFLNRPYYLFFI